MSLFTQSLNKGTHLRLQVPTYLSSSSLRCHLVLGPGSRGRERRCSHEKRVVVYSHRQEENYDISVLPKTNPRSLTTTVVPRSNYPFHRCQRLTDLDEDSPPGPRVVRSREQKSLRHEWDKEGVTLQGVNSDR